MKRKNRKDKKAQSWFAGKVMNLIIVVICVVILMIVALAVYGMFSEKTELERGESGLKLIKERSDLLKESSTTDFIQVIIYPPKTWVLRSYLDAFPDAECYAKKGCLCICQDGSCANNVPKACYGFDYKIEIPLGFEVPRAWYDVRKIVFEATTYENAIGLYNAVEELKIYKSDDKILIEQVKV